MSENSKYKDWGKVTISKKLFPQDVIEGNWKPKSTVNHTPEFVEFINSMLDGNFHQKSLYMPFEIYKAQAFSWLEENTDPYKTDNPEEVIMEEMRRIDENTLYFAEKYAFIKEGSEDSGLLKYKSKEHNALLYYLIDCGYCILCGKPRQIFATTTIGIFLVKRLITRYNYYMKFVTVSDEKGTEILNDKFKFPFQHLPDWMKPKVVGDSINAFHLGEKIGKGNYGYPNSKCEKVAPSPTAINGGAPQMTLIDEIGEVPDLIDILFETRPTLYVDKHQNGDLQLVRQLIAWGCVCAGTKVWDNDGNLVNIEDLKPENGILGYDGNGISKEKITYWQPPTEKECYKITTNTGRYLECSYDHPILWSRKDYNECIEMPKVNGKRVRISRKNSCFKEARDIKIGDQIAIIEEVPFTGAKRMWQPRMIGWLIGDGSYGFREGGHHKTPVISSCDNEINDYISNNFDYTIETERPTKDGKIYKETRIRGIVDELKTLGIYGQKKLQKRLPVGHHSYCEEDICEMLGGFFDTDGCVHYTGAKSTRSIDLTCSCYELLDEVRMLLQRLGIHANISKVKCNPLTNPKDKNDWFVLVVSDVKSVRRFAEKIKFAIKYKQDRLNIVLDYIKDTQPRCTDVQRGLRFERVVSVEQIGIKPIYNLTAGTTNTYIANGIVTHNTGVSSNTGKRAFQQFWQSTVELWKQKEYKAGVFIPLFFSWHCRCTPEIYEGEYKAYMMGNSKNTAGINSEGDRSVIFNMHYPSRPIDMFGMSNNRLVPKSIVEDNLKKIRNLPEDKRPVYGYFEPVYDYNAPLENAYTPFKITDARFVPCEDDDPNVSTCIVKRPDYGWRNRYYQGTDPVLNDVGKSFMASTIWDKCIKTKDKDGDETTTQAPIAFVYHRRAYDPKESYLQCMLLGLYYDTNNPSNKKKGVPEVLENNIGISYRDFKEAYGFGQSLVMNNEIFDMDLQGGGAKWGINTSGHGMNRRKSKVVARLKELIYAYAQNIFYETFFKELDTYVMVQKTESIVYKPIDSKIYRDDCLDATTFAYICAKSFDHKKAYEETTENERVVVSYQYGRDENYNLVLKPVKKRVIN